MPEIAGQHKAGRLRQSPDEELRELLRCDSKFLVIGPHKRTYAETVAYLDQTRETEGWRELYKEFREFAETRGDGEDWAELAAVLGPVIQLMADFTGAEPAELPRSWVIAYLGDDWMEAYHALGGQL
jgi:hypothetical protein